MAPWLMEGRIGHQPPERLEIALRATGSTGLTSSSRSRQSLSLPSASAQPVTASAERPAHAADESQPPLCPGQPVRSGQGRARYTGASTSNGPSALDSRLRLGRRHHLVAEICHRAQRHQLDETNLPVVAPATGELQHVLVIVEAASRRNSASPGAGPRAPEAAIPRQTSSTSPRRDPPELVGVQRIDADVDLASLAVASAAAS